MKRRVRTRVFAGCEGADERALVTAIQKLADAHNVPIYLDSYVASGGSALMVVKRAGAEKVRRSKGDSYDGGAFVLLDGDRLKGDGQEQQVRALAREHKLELVVQIPDLECFLGRLLAGRFDLGDERARAEWKALGPGHEKKGFDALDLRPLLTLDHFRALIRHDPLWAAFLRTMNLK